MSRTRRSPDRAAAAAIPVPRRPDRSTDTGAVAGRLWRAVRGQRGLLAGTGAFAIVSVVLSAAGPLLLGRATDLVLAGAIGRQFDAGTTRAEVVDDLGAQGHGTLARMLGTVDFVPGRGIDTAALGHTLLYATLVYLGAGLCAFVQGWLANLAVQRVIRDLRQDIEVKISRVPVSYFDEHRRGDVLSRVTNDIDNLSQSLQQTLSQLVIPLFSIVGMLAAMFWVSWLLALISLVTAPLSLLVVVLIGKRAQPRYLEQWRQTGLLNGHIEEMYTGHAVVKAFGRERQAAEVFAKGNEALAETTHRAQAASSALQPAMVFLSNLNYVLVAVVGGIRIAAGALTVGDIQAFIQYSRQYSQPLVYLASMAGMVQSGLASAERIYEILDAPEQTPDPAEPNLLATPVTGRVAFEDVTFRYSPARPLIENLSLAAEPGHTVAIVGPTGAGKTTLVNLLLRFYDLDAGRITLDGVDIATLPRPLLRSCVGMVLQDTWLFGGTIADNIAYGARDATRDQIVDAARAAHADRFIRTLPAGYDTMIDDDAVLSAGEKQLLTIARAFLTDPAILVLDEATSSVDTRTEILIQQAMARLRHGRTAFVIAHRLSTIRDADTIVVMNDGAIVEQGTHDTLLAHGGAYARLHMAQFDDATTKIFMQRRTGTPA
ncbi:ABC transporter ATP-binding protein [Frankia sp. CNm7]|uniref:Fatty acid ABC transporter ATP-binding/permease protein n=1 Tax=Frankia nepalensis TaxID=1836974 RepID=A0A937RRS5_9ACTN|nr:ABC transporter ATP-binding protein [Frankia nepalensis]MBL7498242.1 ABC transporter ATP-binding protein [Frankia nepalensis]MBL7509538.1 ABC transporter ATP-binding protein [Frankia nepalensis]MBL7517274.1 ABC transporter ATP-binding protein [Frankia nepalensis]MBL7632169.1 ABC transporter ATP-binding protein [Frankia nepalensis]